MINKTLTLDKDRLISQNDYISDEKIAMFLDGTLSRIDRSHILKLMSKNPDLRRRISDYVKFKRYYKEEKDNYDNKVTSTLTDKAISLFDKYSNKKSHQSKIQVNTECEKYEPVYISYSQNSYKLDGVIKCKGGKNSEIALELMIKKQDRPFVGEIYLYKDDSFYKTMQVDERCINCSFINKGCYHLYIKENLNKAIDLEFDIN